MYCECSFRWQSFAALGSKCKIAHGIFHSTSCQKAFICSCILASHYFISSTLRVCFTLNKNVKSLRRIGCYCATCNSVLSILPDFHSSFVAKRAIRFASSGFILPFFNFKKVKFIHCCVADLPIWIAAITFPMKVFAKLKASSTLHNEGLSKLFRFILSTLSREEALCEKEKQSLLNPVVKVDVSAVVRTSIDKALCN